MAITNMAVFCGMSISPSDVAEILPHAEIYLPISRGDLYRVREQGAQTIVIIDGIFNQKFAVSPREVIDVARDGANIIGASSMGALRASECWPVGVRGVGTIFELYRAGLLTSDDEVAVASVEELKFQSVTVPLINVRYAVFQGRRGGSLSRLQGRRIVQAARELHFSQRQWKTILREARIDIDALPPADGNWLQADLKRVDALKALRYVRSNSVKTAKRAPGATPFASHARYGGHNPFLGRNQEELKPLLLQWLFGSGRYQKYIWPVYVALGGKAGRFDTMADLRHGLANMLETALEDEGHIGHLLWEEMDFVDELRAELMRWHAHQVWGRNESGAESADGPIFDRVREEVAIAHGYRNWAFLTADVHNGKVFGAIPFSWVERAIIIIAGARQNASTI